MFGHSSTGRERDSCSITTGKTKKQATYFETISKAHSSLKAKDFRNDINMHILQIHNT